MAKVLIIRKYFYAALRQVAIKIRHRLLQRPPGFLLRQGLREDPQAELTVFQPGLKIVLPRFVLCPAYVGLSSASCCGDVPPPSPMESKHRARVCGVCEHAGSHSYTVR
jgi:hypothetical protein